MPVLEMVTYVIREKAKKMNATFGNYNLNHRLCAQAQRGNFRYRQKSGYQFPVFIRVAQNVSTAASQ